ncbi:helix-turn-helix transcriptional regulator [Actinocrispum wychmicini]|uniref:Tetratricopeptide repeat protein n=1 Tax=Actinocrispum wychmicini TaxID=1213861 RepID=A0A4R2J2D0_9PSEU|nr:LuxR family transcriptional regulator [Actinocrispum wychmicini]TCO52461.1 tetratricopeptide repeat protein [Actinocrispum wychmicini]
MARSGSVSLIGRDPELGRLVGWLRDLRTGRGHAILVEGEPGIGKSILVKTACAETTFPVFWGCGDELGQDIPLVPLLDGLRVHSVNEPRVNEPRPTESSAGTDARRDTIARLMRGEVQIAPGMDVSTAVAEHLLALLEELCAAGPVVLVVDDLQWADRHTIALCGRLARLVRQLPLLFIGITRPVPRQADLVALRRSMPSRMRLTRLGDADVLKLVTVLAGGTPSDRLLRLSTGAAGNPLYVTELVGSLARGGRLFVTESGMVETTTGRTPRSLSAAIAERLGFLPEPVLDVLRTAALLGADFSVQDLAIVSGQATATLIPSIEEARAAGILTESADGMAFRHPLIRMALYEQLPVSVRAAWHAEAGRALAAAGASVDRVARQLLPAGDAGAEWMAQWLVDAAPTLVGHAPKVAVELLRRALATGPHDELSWRLADALYQTGEPAEAELVASRALLGAPPPDLFVELHRIMAQCRSLAGKSVEALPALKDALDTPGLTTAHRARLLVLTARTHRALGQVDDAEALATAALEQTDDRFATGWALHVLTLVAMMRGAMVEALPLFERALAVSAGDPELTDLRLLLRINQAVTFGDLDRYAEAVAAVGQVRQEAERTGSLVRLSQAQSAMGQLLLDTGGWDGALAEVDVLPNEVKDPSVVCCDRGVAAVISFHRGDPETARTNLDAAAPYESQMGQRVVWALSLARSLDAEYTGDPRAAFAELVTGLDDKADIEDLLPDAVRLAVQVGDLTMASSITARVESNVDSGPRRRAAALYCRGLLDQNPAQLLEAAAQYSTAGRPLPRAKALEAAAIAFVAVGDRTSARAAFTLAGNVYEDLAATWDIARLAAIQRSAGIRRGPRVAHRKASHGWESLTPTESTIAALVVSGMTNRQIAARLFLSPRTVGTHVSHILTKLGVGSRTDIAREAASRASG